MVSLGKSISDVKLIRKTLRSFPERFRIKVTTTEESKDQEEMKIEKLVRSLQTYEYSLASVRNKFKKKFSNRLKKAPHTAEPEEVKKKDPRGPQCFECSGCVHIKTECANLKKLKGKAFNATLSGESKKEEETLKEEKFLAFVAPHGENEDSQSYYSENNDDEDTQTAYQLQYVEFLKLREKYK
jgi:hypothetical protein